MAEHSYGWKKDPFDKRDSLYSLSFPAKALPTEVDLRSHVSEVSNQGSLGSCTGFAIADGMRENLLITQYGKEVADAVPDMSPLYVYYHERVIEGTVNEDNGAYIRDGFKVISGRGCATEKAWPYVESKFKVAPDANAETVASNYKVNTYHRLNNLNDIKACLAEGYGCVFGFTVKGSFESIGSDGRMPMPEAGEYELGGHAVFICGYKDTGTPSTGCSLAIPAMLKRKLFGASPDEWEGGGYLIIKNSWGKNWGDKGYFYMPYAYVTSSNVSDIWTAR